MQGAHFVLILYFCALSSSSHLAALITLRKYFRKYKLIAKIRLILVVVFAACLFASMIAAISMPSITISRKDTGVKKRSRVQRLAFLVPMLFILVGFGTALVCILHNPDRKSLKSRTSDPSGPMAQTIRRVADPNLKKQRSFSPPSHMMEAPAHYGIRLMWFLLLNPFIAFTVQILLAALSTVLVLTQKFSKPDKESTLCGLQNEGVNTWGFGQTLSVTMLLLPAMSACHTYLEGMQDIRG